MSDIAPSAPPNSGNLAQTGVTSPRPGGGIISGNVGKWSSSAEQADTWWEYFFGPTKYKAKKSTDASHDPAVRMHFNQMLDHTDPPDSFKPTEVAQMLTVKELRKLGYEEWQELLPAIYELAFETREFGDCEILSKGKVLGEDVDLMGLDGPIRVRRTGV